MSSITKKYMTGYIICSILSFLAVMGPTIYYMIMGWQIAGSSQKFVLCSAAIFCIVLTLINLIFKYHLRSTVFIILIALAVVFTNALTLIIVFASLQLLDEIILTPLAKYYKTRMVINRQVDKRL